jgi:Tfp pilus assembly pilus retraction ATPase PilT
MDWRSFLESKESDISIAAAGESRAVVAQYANRKCTIAVLELMPTTSVSSPFKSGQNDMPT